MFGRVLEMALAVAAGALAAKGVEKAVEAGVDAFKGWRASGAEARAEKKAKKEEEEKKKKE